MYIHGLADLESKPFKEPILELEFDFERRRSTKNDVRELELGMIIGPSLGGFLAHVYIFNCHHQMKMLSSLHM
ncbi:putative mitogen-activated protein kinase [Helianthus anomalus]